MSPTSDLFQQALALPEPDRAELAYQLLLSLDASDPDDDWAQAWAIELESRSAALQEGRASARDWREVADEIRKDYLSGPHS